MEEVFVVIKGFENNYSVSNLGTVKNIITGKLRKNVLSKHGYYRVDLKCDGSEFIYSKKYFFIKHSSN